MGLFQDNFSMLSELERLAAMVVDPVRIHEIGADQWPLAMIACGLMTGNDPARLQDNINAYEIFCRKVTPSARGAALKQLVRFITQRKGEGWRAFIPFAICEPEALISSAAAMQLATLAQPSATQKLHGVEALVEILMRLPQCNPAALSALLGLSDMRVLPLLEKLCNLTDERLQPLLESITPSGNHLSYQWVLSVLSAHPALAPAVTDLLERMAATAPTVLDLVLPIPTWSFEKPTPQPLHGWTRPEYLARMLPILKQHLSESQLARLSSAFAV
ncbi:MAG: hypothetical protein IKV13_07045 [Akkermansia sp.]|nr:hypothetical protein [Akkermansia sp.]MBR5876855.1 hypothetical protein [Akkermansia sp.]